MVLKSPPATPQSMFLSPMPPRPAPSWAKTPHRLPRPTAQACRLFAQPDHRAPARSLRTAPPAATATPAHLVSSAQAAPAWAANRCSAPSATSARPASARPAAVGRASAKLRPMAASSRSAATADWDPRAKKDPTAGCCGWTQRPRLPATDRLFAGARVSLAVTVLGADDGTRAVLAGGGDAVAVQVAAQAILQALIAVFAVRVGLRDADTHALALAQAAIALPLAKIGLPAQQFAVGLTFFGSALAQPLPSADLGALALAVASGYTCCATWGAHAVAFAGGHRGAIGLGRTVHAGRTRLQVGCKAGCLRLCALSGTS